MPGLRYAVDGRKADAVAHLALARTQNTGPAFWVTTKEKGGRLARPLFVTEEKEEVRQNCLKKVLTISL